LRSVLREQAHFGGSMKDDPVAWRALDYGPTSAEGRGDDYYGPRHQWNIEQATRRALRSLERRGLVELATYSFRYDGTDGVWVCYAPDEHVPGQHRWMTGVKLTDASRVIAEEEEATRQTGGGDQ
jgi:hypothetical protein